MSTRSILATILIAVTIIVGGVSLSSIAQDVAKSPSKPAADGTFEFDVNEIFDAKYPGDTPGYVGRHGGLHVTPLIALGDPIYRDKRPVGRVTRVEWNQVHGSLEVEFAPNASERIRIGEVVWLKFGEENAR